LKVLEETASAAALVQATKSLVSQSSSPDGAAGGQPGGGFASIIEVTLCSTTSPFLCLVLVARFHTEKSSSARLAQSYDPREALLCVCRFPKHLQPELIQNAHHGLLTSLIIQDYGRHFNCHLINLQLYYKSINSTDESSVPNQTMVQRK